MNNTKEKQSKLQIIISILVLTVILFAEMYLMINFNESYLPIIILAVVALTSVYVMVNAFMTLNEIKEARRNEHFENLYKSEKASYIMLKKSFDEIEDKLNELQESSKIPAEELINAQKGIAKVIINRSKENADAIINSNDQVLERLDEVEETQNTKFTSLSKEQRLKLTDMGTQTEMKIQDLIVQLKDTELRLNQAIMNGTKVVMPAPVAYAPVEAPVVDNSSIEDSPLDISLDEMSLDELFNETNDVLNVADELLGTEEPFSNEDLFATELEPVVEELPPMPDLSDPNKAMSPDEIAALIANMAPAEEPAPEPIVEPEPVVEELPPMPDLSDPNKVMSPDEIAALIANL